MVTAVVAFLHLSSEVQISPAALAQPVSDSLVMNRSWVQFPQAAPIERHTGYKGFPALPGSVRSGVFAVLGGSGVGVGRVVLRAAPSRGGIGIRSLHKWDLTGRGRKRQKGWPSISMFIPASKSGLASKVSSKRQMMYQSTCTCSAPTGVSWAQGNLQVRPKKDWK